MRAIRVHGPWDIRMEDRPMLRAHDGEVVVRVLATGICGTDLEIVDGTMGYFTQGIAQFPLTPGHEWVGDIEMVGAGVVGFAKGDRVVGECSIGCNACALCLSGNYHRCEGRTETGILNRDGGFAEFLCVPALYLHKISAAVDLGAAALVEPCAVAFNGVQMAGISPADDLVIHGDGPIGLLALQVARCFGPKRIVVVGATDERLALASALGADAVIDVRKADLCTALRVALGGRLPNKAIEATGRPEAAANAISAIEPGGTVVLQGLFAGRLLQNFDLDQIVLRDLTVRGALGSPNVWPHVIALIESGRIDPAAVVSHTLPLDQFADGVALVRDRIGIKVMILPGTDQEYFAS